MLAIAYICAAQLRDDLQNKSPEDLFPEEAAAIFKAGLLIRDDLVRWKERLLGHVPWVRDLARNLDDVRCLFLSEIS